MSKNRADEIAAVVGPKVTERKRRFVRVQEGKCFFCGCQITTSTVTADHILPIKKRGFAYGSAPGMPWNLVGACNSCNSRKGNRWPTPAECRKALRMWASEIAAMERYPHPRIIVIASLPDGIDIGKAELREYESGLSNEQIADTLREILDSGDSADGASR